MVVFFEADDIPKRNGINGMPQIADSFPDRKRASWFVRGGLKTKN